MNARPQVLVRGPGLCLRDLRQGPLLWLVRTPETGVPLDISVLDAHERRRAAALRRPVERALYVAAHGALRRVLGAYAGLPPAAVRLARQRCPACGGPHGRPVLSGPAGRALHFSLGYSGGLALLALASEPVGVDVERVPGPKRAEEAARVLHASELRELARMSVEGRPGGFARCWTRKEAHRKATGEGLSCEAPRDRYLGAGLRPARLPGWRTVDVDVPGGWAAACVVRSAGEVTVRR